MRTGNDRETLNLAAMIVCLLVSLAIFVDQLVVHTSLFD
jgi:hypothetical protein